MKNTELTIGTKVSYNKVSLKNGETTSLESVVVGFFDGYVSLENGDKMFKQALTTIKTHTMENKGITITKGKSYGMVHGGSMIQKKRKPIIKKMNTAPALQKPSKKPILIKKVGYGSKVPMKKAGGCGCGGGMVKHQQGGVVGQTGSDIDSNQFNAVQSRVFPGGVPAAMGAAGFNSPASSNQATVPGSSKSNEETVLPVVNGIAGTNIQSFLKGLKLRRQNMGMMTGMKSVPMTDKKVFQYGGGKTAGNKVDVDSVGGRIS